MVGVLVEKVAVIVETMSVFTVDDETVCAAIPYVPPDHEIVTWPTPPCDSHDPMKSAQSVQLCDAIPVSPVVNVFAVSYTHLRAHET